MLSGIVSRLYCYLYFLNAVCYEKVIMQNKKRKKKTYRNMLGIGMSSATGVESQALFRMNIQDSHLTICKMEWFGCMNLYGPVQIRLFIQQSVE